MDNQTLRCFAARQLRYRAEKSNPQEGAALHNLYKIGLDSHIIEEIMTCLKSNDRLDISTGLYFSIGLLQHYQLKDFGNEFIRYFIQRIPELINYPSSQVRTYALQFFVWLRANYPDYRGIMLNYLKSEDLGYRESAVNNYETFAKPGEIEPLLPFQEDDYVAELAMCGPLEYQFRDIALKKISEMVGKNFLLNRLKERHPEWPNDYVSWYDWGPFLTWYQRQAS